MILQATESFNYLNCEEILKVPKSFKIFNRFKEKVLFKAKEDINKFTDLQIDFIEKKLAQKGGLYQVYH